MRWIVAVVVMLAGCGGMDDSGCAESGACAMTSASEALCWWKDGATPLAASRDGYTACTLIPGSEARIAHPSCGSAGQVNSARYACP